jgi:hypothetical protein
MEFIYTTYVQTVRVHMQLADAPGAVLVTFSLIAISSLVPLFQGREPESRCMGPFNAAVERLSGRAAYVTLSSSDVHIHALPVTVFFFCSFPLMVT